MEMLKKSSKSSFVLLPISLDISDLSEELLVVSLNLYASIYPLTGPNASKASLTFNISDGGRPRLM